MLLACIAVLSVVIWCVLLFGRGDFWHIDRHLAPYSLRSTGEYKVAVVIPARDEAEHIGSTVASLIDQSYSGLWHIIVVDDHSTDGTREAALAAARGLDAEHMLTVLDGCALPSGWTGKLWAVQQGTVYASQFSPDFFLLTDADILHGPDSLGELVDLAETGGYDLVSFMVKLRCETLAEKLLIPAFVFFFFLLYPPAWIASPKRSTAGAAGGCMLLRPSRLSQIGGMAAIAGQVIDDCALARAVKRSGGRVWLGLTDDRFSMRSYRTFAEVGRMISRTAFNQLNHSFLLLAATLGGLCLVYLAPVALLFTFDPYLSAAGALAWILMSAAYIPMVRFYRLRPEWALALPLVALFYSGATMHSAIQYWLGRGGLWKGRTQDA